MLPQPYVSKEICFSIKPVSEWSLTPHPLFVKDMPYLRIEDLGYLDFAAFESIRFEIEPPQTPGECFYMFRRQIMPIMRSIQGSQQRYTYVPDARLREVHIVFTDVGSTEQSDGSSLANGRPYDPYLDPMHFANIFVAFKTLRQIDHLYIQPRMKALDNESFQKGVAWKIKELQAITRSSYWEEAESPQAVADSLENLRLSHERNGVSSMARSINIFPDNVFRTYQQMMDSLCIEPAPRNYKREFSKCMSCLRCAAARYKHKIHILPRRGNLCYQSISSRDSSWRS